MDDVRTASSAPIVIDYDDTSDAYVSVVERYVPDGHGGGQAQAYVLRVSIDAEDTNVVTEVPLSSEQWLSLADLAIQAARDAMRIERP